MTKTVSVPILVRLKTVPECLRHPKHQLYHLSRDHLFYWLLKSEVRRLGENRLLHV